MQFEYDTLVVNFSYDIMNEYIEEYFKGKAQKCHKEAHIEFIEDDYTELSNYTETCVLTDGKECNVASFSRMSSYEIRRYCYGIR